MKKSNRNVKLKIIDKYNWENLEFQKIANKISDTVNPKETKTDIYIGLEHLDSNDIHIRRKGSPNQVKGNKLKCFPGDIIFGKRRAYQRKAAIINFEGICSAHSFIFRANTVRINNELLPFFLHSDQFMNRMIDISVGGLSPTINWNDLKFEKFLIPPKNKQSKISKLLWSSENLIEIEKKILQKLEILRKALSSELFTSANFIKIDNKDYFQNITSGIDKFSDSKEYISTKCVKNFTISKSEKEISYTKRPSRANMQPVKNSLWFAKMKNTLKVIKPSENDIQKYIFSTGFCGIKINEKLVDLDYLFHYFLSDMFNRIKDSKAKGTTQKAVSDFEINNFLIPLPDIKKQKIISNKLNKVLESIIEIENKIKCSKDIKQKLINYFF